MHELAVSRRLIRVIEEQAIVHGYGRVKTVWVGLGPFTCIEPHALRIDFDTAAHDTCAEGAQLEIRPVPASGYCPECRTTEPVSDYFADCPTCGRAVEISGGTTLKIAELEVV